MAAFVASEEKSQAEVEKHSEREPVKCTEVDLNMILVYFSCDAWQAVPHLVDIVRRYSVWLCFACK